MRQPSDAALIKKSHYDQERQQERLEIIQDFIDDHSRGWPHNWAKKKLREFASGLDEKPELPDISGLLSHG